MRESNSAVRFLDGEGQCLFIGEMVSNLDIKKISSSHGHVMFHVMDLATWTAGPIVAWNDANRAFVDHSDTPKVKKYLSHKM
jgi:hypothetical protein